MIIVLLGAGGTIGGVVRAALEAKGHRVVAVSRSAGDQRADIADAASLRALFGGLGAFDAVACAAGEVAFAPLGALTDAQWSSSLANKLMGQIDVVRAALPFIADRGSFTLISGVLADEPIVGGAAAATVNGALEAFTRAAAVELPRGLRINCVSPTVLTESMPMYAASFPGFVPVDGARVAEAYVRAICGPITGRVLKVV